MSLLRKASIVTTPTAYENGKILSVKPSIVLGNELVTNGTFQTNSDWTLGTGWSIGDGVAKSTQTSSNNYLQQTISTLANNKLYRITFDLDIISASTTTIGISNTGSFGQLSGSERFYTTSGTKTLEALYSNSFPNYIRFVGGANTEFTITNVSIKEVLDADFDFTRNSSATRVNSQGLIEDMQILSGDLVSNGDFSQEGSELITNGDFSNGSTDWFNPDNAATFSNNSVIITGGSGNRRINQSNVTSPTSSQWKLQYEITEKVGTSDLKVYTTNSGSATYVVVPSTIGVHTYFFNTNLTTFYFNFSNSAGSITIDNVSVKEVGQDWTFVNADISIGNNGLEIISQGGNRPQANQSVSGLTIGKKYKLSSLAKRGTCVSSVEIEISGIGSTVETNKNNTTEFANIFYEFTATSTSHTIQAKIDDGASTIGETAFFKSVSLIEITEDTNLPRIDYTGGEGHWLFEPQSTNLFTESENFSNGDWTVYGGDSITPNNAVSPQGTQNASKLNDVGGIYEQRPYNPNTNYIFSVFAKTDTSTSITINFVDQAAGYLGGAIKYTFATNVASVILQSANGSVVAEKEDYGNGWIRVILKFTTNSAQNFNYQSIEFQGGDGWIWGAQLEQLSYATSYIPTEGSIKTRLQDAAFGAGSSDLINSTEGVLYAEIASLADFSGSISINDATVSNRIELGFTSSSRAIIYMEVGGVLQVYERPAVSDITSFYKIAFKWKLNDFSLYINGNKVAASSSGVTPSANTFNNLSFNGFYSNNFFGKTKCLAVFKEALNNDELECLTGEGYDSFNALALANNYTII